MEELMSKAFDGVALIEEIQLNRAPWLMVDRIDECDPGKRVVAIKNFSLNEWFFPLEMGLSSFVPGFIAVECMVQAFIMTFLSMDKYRGEQTADISIEDIEIHHQLRAGTTMRLVATLDSVRFGIATGKAEGWVDGILASEARMVVAIPSVLRRMTPTGR